MSILWALQCVVVERQFELIIIDGYLLFYSENIWRTSYVSVILQTYCAAVWRSYRIFIQAIHKLPFLSVFQADINYMQTSNTDDI